MDPVDVRRGTCSECGKRARCAVIHQADDFYDVALCFDCLHRMMCAVGKAVPPDPGPPRRCTGTDREYCGNLATHVAKDVRGCEWFTCETHTRGRTGITLTTIESWFGALGLPVPGRDPENTKHDEARDAADRLAVRAPPATVEKTCGACSGTGKRGRGECPYCQYGKILVHVKP
jgi:hypothetical protein